MVVNVVLQPRCIPVAFVVGQGGSGKPVNNVSNALDLLTRD